MDTYVRYNGYKLCKDILLFQLFKDIWPFLQNQIFFPLIRSGYITIKNTQS